MPQDLPVLLHNDKRGLLTLEDGNLDVLQLSRDGRRRSSLSDPCSQFIPISLKADQSAQKTVDMLGEEYPSSAFGVCASWRKDAFGYTYPSCQGQQLAIERNARLGRASQRSRSCRMGGNGHGHCIRRYVQPTGATSRTDTDGQV